LETKYSFSTTLGPSTDIPFESNLKSPFFTKKKVTRLPSMLTQPREFLDEVVSY
jgi:hypothetical protein